VFWKIDLGIIKFMCGNMILKKLSSPLGISMFWLLKVAFKGLVREGILVDPIKVYTIVDWLRPSNNK
jgi:hypothetical protein